MNIRELVRSNRSCRRFEEHHRVDISTLRELVDLARCSASAANRQPLRYILSADPDTNAGIFSCLGWAAYLKDWPGPSPGERPAAYIVILGDRETTNNYWCDHGIAAQSMLLGARAQGLAGCMFGAINANKLRGLCDIPPRYDILLVLAIGKPVEHAVLETVDDSGNIRYWRDADGIHHVPKRTLEELIVETYGD